MICQLVHLFEFCANQLIIEKIVINYVNLFFQRLLHDYTHEKRQVWDKADLNLFQYSRLCQIMDFQLGVGRKVHNHRNLLFSFLSFSRNGKVIFLSQRHFSFLSTPDIQYVANIEALKI